MNPWHDTDSVIRNAKMRLEHDHRLTTYRRLAPPPAWRCGLARLLRTLAEGLEPTPTSTPPAIPRPTPYPEPR